jgi:hypothetical protein
MKKFLEIVLFIAIICFIYLIGYSGVVPQGPNLTPGSQESRQAATGGATVTGGTGATTTPKGVVIIDERINLMSGYQTTYEKFAFEDYGSQYLYPGDSYRISVNSDRPVNVLVIDKDDEIKFPSVEPEWNTVLKKDQWDYSPLVPVFSQSNVLRKDMILSIKDKGSYFIIIDPRFASDQGGWKGSRHDEVHVDVIVAKM